MVSSTIHRVATATTASFITKVASTTGRTTTTRVGQGVAWGTTAKAATATRSFVSVTLPRFEKHTINVPTMGDSITEGTIVEWTAQIGQAVKEGDVVALVETDKVTVDIKAEIDGVLTQQFGAVDDTVEVGASLYELDTEAEATVVVENENGGGNGATAATTAADDAVPVETVSPAVSADAPPPAATTTTTTGRVPSIQFLGKAGWANRLSPTPTASVPTSPTGSVTLDGSTITSNYGRPTFSEAEMEALMMGGANLAPNVISASNGAKFG